MADESWRKRYDQADFGQLQGSIAENLELIRAGLSELALGAPVNEARLALGGASLVVEWATLPTQQDVADVTAFINGFAGGSTSSAPVVATNAGPVDASSATPVTVIDVETTPRDAGVYSLNVSCQMRMVAEVAGDAARAITTVTVGNAPPRSQVEHWPYPVDHAYNLPVTVDLAAGQTMRVQLQIAEVGPGAGTARMTDARVTIDRTR